MLKKKNRVAKAREALAMDGGDFQGPGPRAEDFPPQKKGPLIWWMLGVPLKGSFKGSFKGSIGFRGLGFRV